MNSAALALSALMFGVNAVVYLIIGVAIPLMVRSGDGVGIGAFPSSPGWHRVRDHGPRTWILEYVGACETCET